MRSLGRTFVGLFAARVLTLIGGLALISGLLLWAIGLPAAWLAWSGGLVAGVAFASLHLLPRSAQRALDRVVQEELMTIYMPLLKEGTDVWRPVEARKVMDLGYMVTENPAPGEDWAFEPGHILHCEERQLRDGRHLVAVTKAI